MWLKACPRCRLGDMCPDQDGGRLCLQCGYIQHSVVVTTSGVLLDQPRPDELTERRAAPRSSEAAEALTL